MATVNSATGLVTAVGAGNNEYYLFLQFPGCGAPASAQIPLIVSPDASAGTISGTPTTCIGATTTYTSSGDPGGSWSSNNTAVATVNSGTGVITGVSTGSATITYTVSTGCNSPKSASLAITVSPDAIVGTISGTPTTICIAGTTTYSITGNSAAGSWSSSDNTIATVSSSGVVTGVAAGTANIIYTVNTGCNAPVQASKQITVSASANAGTITGNSSICVTANNVPYFTSGDANGTWSISPTTVATIDPVKGLVKGISTGSATITYKVTACGTASATFYQYYCYQTAVHLQIRVPPGRTCVCLCCLSRACL